MSAELLAVENERLLACVHCGFCLTACPTYTRLGDEADSPRGRLYLMSAAVEGRLDPGDDAFRTHIGRCLGCRACEPVCPSGVQYGFLLERARAEMIRAAGESALSRAVLYVVARPWLVALFSAAGRAVRATGLAGPLARALPARLGSARLALAMLAASRAWPGLRAATVAPGSAAVPVEATPPTATPSGPQGERGECEAPGDDALRGQGDVTENDREAPGPGDVTGAATGPNREVAEPHAHAAGLHAGTSVAAPTQGPESDRASRAVAVDTAGHAGPAGERPTGASAPTRAGVAASTEATTAAPGTAATPPRPRVAILEGCVQSGLFARVNDATVSVLEASGCDVVAVPRQRCCGALHAHSGDLATALRLARANIAAFEEAGADHVVVNAAGCGAIMKEYGEQFARDPDPDMRDRAEAFSARVRDLSEELDALGTPAGAPVPLRVTFDSPCHLIHAQRIIDAPLRVLAEVPGLEIVPLPGYDECCGGAGIYGLQHPDLAARVLDDKLDAIRGTHADVVLTSNPGCIMQIGAGLVLRGDDRPVLHPVEIIAESCRRAAMLDSTTNGSRS